MKQGRPKPRMVPRVAGDTPRDLTEQEIDDHYRLPKRTTRKPVNRSETNDDHSDHETSEPNDDRSDGEDTLTGISLFLSFFRHLTDKMVQ